MAKRQVLTAASAIETGISVDKPPKNRPFPSCLEPLCQNDSWREAIHVEMRVAYRFIFMQNTLIFIWKVLHEDSICNRETK